MGDRASIAARVAAGMAVLVLGAVAAAILRDPAAPDELGVECRPAVEIDGGLACGADAVARVRARCGPAADVADGDRYGAGDCRPGRMPPPQLRALGVVLDINAAPAADLTSLPGVGPVLADRIVAARPFTDVPALRRVRGIGPATLARIRPRVQVRSQLHGGGGAAPDDG